MELLHADQLPSQPCTTTQDVQRALVGQATIDRKWWEALAPIQTTVATQENEILGAASYGVQKRDGSRCLLWLHTREDRPVIEALMTAVFAALQQYPRIYAFWFATPLTVELRGCPSSCDSSGAS